MAITTVAIMLADMTQPNVNCGPFGYPEVPSLDWGNNQGGYILDYQGSQYPFDATYITQGGWYSNQYQTHTLPWWQLMNTYKNPLTNKNPVKNFMWLQVRNQRRYYNRTATPSQWDLQGTSVDPSTDSEHYFGDSLTMDYKPLGAATYVRNGQTITVADPGRARVSASTKGGGSFYVGSRDWVVHGYPLGDDPANFSLYRAALTTVQFRLVPGTTVPGPTTLSQDFNWDLFDAGFSVGLDWYWQTPSRGTNGPCCFSRLVRPTNRWQVVTAGTVREDRFVRKKAKGLTEAEYTANPAPLPPEEEVWLERGAHNGVTNKQIMVIKRSAAVTTSKQFTIRVLRGTVTLADASATMNSGQSAVSFEMNTPGGAIPGQQVVHVSDGGTEDHYGTFTIGTGSATADPGGSPTPAPAPPPVTGSYLTVSKALDGTNPVRLGQFVLVPPSSLDITNVPYKAAPPKANLNIVRFAPNMLLSSTRIAQPPVAAMSIAKYIPTVTATVGAAWSPSDESTLIAWFDMQNTSLFNNTTKAWTARLGTGQFAISSGSGPTLINNGFGASEDALQFTLTSDTDLRWTPASPGFTQIVSVMVIRVTTFGAGAYAVLQTRQSGMGAAGGMGLFDFGGGQVQYANTTGKVEVYSPSWVNTNAILVSLQSLAARRWRINGAEVGSETTLKSGNEPTGTEPVDLFPYTGASISFTGHIACVGFFHASGWSTTLAQKIEGYIAHQGIGVTTAVLPVGHPYKTTAP